MGYTSYSLKVGFPNQESTPLEICLKCNHKIEIKHRFCSNCGAPALIDEVSKALFIIADFRSSNEEAEYALAKDGTFYRSSKWYDADTDIKEFSKKYPGALFTLSAEGEEAGDVRLYYIQNGKSHTQKIEIKFDPFDPKKLK